MSSPTATVSQLINCPAETAFEAFVLPQHITRFWLRSASEPLAPGGSATWDFLVPGVSDTIRVLDFVPGSQLSLEWSDGATLRLCFAEQHVSHQTRVSAEFSYASNEPLEYVISTAEGYTTMLCDLKTLLETGESAGLVQAKADLISLSLTTEQADA